jgi:hypothetical protein
MGRADQHILDAGALWQRGDEQDSGGDILRLEHLTPLLSARWHGTPVVSQPFRAANCSIRLIVRCEQSR